MLNLLLAISCAWSFLLIIYVAYILFVCVMFLVDKFLNNGKLKFHEYIKYW